MFRPRRRYGRYGRGGGGIGIFLLGLQLMQLFNFISRSNDYFPVTLGVLALNIAAYLQPSAIAWPSVQQACISVQGVWFQRQWKRVLLAPFFHSSDFHLYYNMASFIWKAISLERHFGTPYFLYMISVFSVGTSTLYLGINYMLAELLDQWSYITSCAIGFSAVIFALKVVTTHMQPAGHTRVMGVIPVPMRLACWVELILVSVLFPHVSFIGHLAGILVGLAFVSGPLKTVMDIPLSLIAGQPGMAGADGHRAYTYRADYTGYRTQRPPPDDTDTNTEERELQEAIRRSLDDRPATAHTSGNDEEESALQAAVERSLADSDPPPSAPIPPYNPHFQSEQSSNSICFSGTEQSTGSMHNESTTVRRRHIETKQDSETNSLDAVRAARLRRFGSKR